MAVRHGSLFYDKVRRPRHVETGLARVRLPPPPRWLGGAVSPSRSGGVEVEHDATPLFWRINKRGFRGKFETICEAQDRGHHVAQGDGLTGCRQLDEPDRILTLATYRMYHRNSFHRSQRSRYERCCTGQSPLAPVDSELAP